MTAFRMRLFSFSLILLCQTLLSCTSGSAPATGTKTPVPEKTVPIVKMDHGIKRIEKAEMVAQVSEELAMVYEVPLMSVGSAPMAWREETLPTSASAQLSVVAENNVQEDVMPEFPWPPPKPSAQAKIPAAMLNRREGARLKDLDSQLQIALERAGYQNRKYLRVPSPTGGFVIATNLERYESSGASSPEPDRWVVSDSTTHGFGIATFLRALLTGKTGDYRLIVLTVTNHPFGSNPEDSLTHRETQDIMTRGWNGLPRSLANAEWTEQVEVNVLVYEFEKKEGSQPMVREPKLNGNQHLTASRILAGLSSPNP